MSRVWWVAGLFLATASVVPIACATGGDETTNLGPGGGGGEDSGSADVSLGMDVGDPGDGTSFNVDVPEKPEISADAFWADDPPPKVCGDSGVSPKVPGGTPECPDDKNREGCPCFKEGEKVSCWPGFRKNRNRGICHDGTTTCTRKGETSLAWGPCMDYQLPTGTTGKEACTCFSGGSWIIANLSPCFFSNSTGAIIGAVSTIPTYDSTGKVTDIQCPATFDKPSANWSKTTLTVDCAGRFKLCFTIKAGDAKAPKDSDCVVTRQCVEGDYTTINKPQPFGDLPAWINKDPACSAQFDKIGGYGEMSVDGTSVECDAVNKIFNRVPYCPTKCNDPAHKADAECVSCGSGGGGSF